ncbi:ribosome assembly RNA-binding protein YhbY [Alkalicoccus urumqiensis]|uniref:Ribosome assembly RNA-binding protein YhbY n=1 Tax=Alkalicoccus urumqiensis TaxID=1548213 RepID=A0A2P6MFN5_ALKUR|nr:ribosome assembly RNA-binding protein YhbY [Alkalicoccus urumqiensis]PRO65077.1 ribosome assembly RNA-binding protein YhbY [Alkalicoccus urumqiensis]
MLTGKQKRYLRKEAHSLKPILQVGKGGINENVIKQADDALEAHELIKVSVLQNNMEENENTAEQLTAGTKSNLVQIIGNTIILYRPSRNNRQIELPERGR